MAATRELVAANSAKSTIALFEKALGGRESVIESLAIDSTPAIQRFLRVLLDPEFDSFSLGELAEQAQIGLTDLLRAYRNATLIKAHILATKAIADRLPALAADVMERAMPQEAMCPVCRGTGTPPGGSRKKGDAPEACKTCDSTGKVTRPPTVARQRLALEIAELLRKDRPAFHQQINVVNPTAPVAPGSLEQLQSAVTSILYQRAAVPAAIDVTPTSSSDAGVDRG